MNHTNACCKQGTLWLNINSGAEYRNISVFKRVELYPGTFSSSLRSTITLA
jgi:hypothetical protein